MEPDHPIVIARLAFIFLCALPAVRELFQYVNDPRQVLLSYNPPPRVSLTKNLYRKTVRMGQHVWLLLATVLTELIVILKWSIQAEVFPEPMPLVVKIGWGVGASVGGVLYPLWQVCYFALFSDVPRQMY